MIWRTFTRSLGKKLVAKRVLHLSSAHPWTDNRIHWRQATSLVSAGYDVGLYAVATDDDVATPVKVTTVPAMPRLKRMTVGTLRAFRVALSSNAEVIHLHDPELIWTIPLLRASGRKVIYDAHEDLPAQVMDKSYLPSPVRRTVSQLAKALVLLAGASSSGIIAATETIAKRFSNEKTTVVRNFPPLNSENAREMRVENREPQAVYVGGISHTRGAKVMVEAFASEALPPEWKLLMAGSATPEILDELQQSPGWERVSYHGKVPPIEARELISQSRIGIVVLKNTVAYRDSLPTKMFEYMADGAAVIASDFPLFRSILERYDCGLLVDETSPDALASAIARYANDTELLRRHSHNGMKAATEELNWAKESEKLLVAYQNVSTV